MPRGIHDQGSEYTATFTADEMDMLSIIVDVYMAFLATSPAPPEDRRDLRKIIRKFAAITNTDQTEEELDEEFLAIYGGKSIDDMYREEVAKIRGGMDA